ncbi:hypothetical protein FJ414_28285 [Mesorhizobium sp. B3-1-6]|uniref:hypothetical protein n=1 Tax=Mesorhizobium sp. B3-1-6 TaxID=2589895 RepID=UPI00112CDB82|nr:hypothetical protein [Mesorhizobium sp. B3-1-6]TPI27886.1 hypothetical protein FJ414_28285 [Mesorhizobium sp. B3-1-6]
MIFHYNILFRIIYWIIGSIVILWLLFFFVHLFVPTQRLNDVSTLAADISDHLFGEVQAQKRDYPRGQSLDAVQIWIDACYPPGVAERTNAEKNLNSQEIIVYRNLGNLVFRMGDDQSTASKVIEAVQSNGNILSIALIGLGMLTTIFSAINSSEIGTGSGNVAITVKILAIVFPALVTAVASLNSIYANSEIAARKARMNSSMIGLATDMSTGLLGKPCIGVENKVEDVVKLAKDWNQKYSDILSSSLVSLGTGQGPSAPQKK